MEDNLKSKYWYGWWNKFSRYFFYLNRGADVFSQFKYIAGYILALYVLLKLTDPHWLLIMAVITLPILFVCGYWHVHKVGKVVDWLNIQYSSHWSRYQFELMEKQLKLLEEINDKLAKEKCGC